MGAVVVVVIAFCAAGCSIGRGAGESQAPRGEVTLRMVTVGDPGNASVGVVSLFGAQGNPVNTKPPANGGIYKNCTAAPPGPTKCLTVGGVDYTYKIGELEVTVEQHVAFLNTVDPNGKNPEDLYVDSMSPTVWPKYGSIAYTQDAGEGEHYAVAYPEWADKPFGFATFLRAARFVNSLFNGDVLSRLQSTSDGFTITTYTVRLGRKTETGMYDLTDSGTGRQSETGFVIPSNDEWVKAAYYNPKGGGEFSYWQYPTGPTDPPKVSKLDPATGDVVNASTQPLLTYSPQGPGAPAGTYPTWCPSQAGASACSTVNPLELLPGLGVAYSHVFQANLSTVGETKTRSPWGTLDQGGNVVEWQDTIVTPPPPGSGAPRTWRRLHGGVANAAGHQLLIAAFGVFPQDDPLVGNANPWVGFRVGVIGDLK